MWLSNSSIGRKVVMSVTGIALVLFLTFHMAMNLVALFSEDAYNMICEFLGANWYALVATAGLGIVVIAGLALHFANFWYKMQFAEIIGVHDLGAFGPTDGAAYIRETFGCPVFTVLYLIWLAALWFHLTHGFWSALQTLGWSNKIWFERWKTIGNIYSTLVVLGFAAVVVIYFVKSLACGAC